MGFIKKALSLRNWVRSRYEYLTDEVSYDLRGDACNTEIIREDDWLFGLVPRAPDQHR